MKNNSNGFEGVTRMDLRSNSSQRTVLGLADLHPKRNDCFRLRRKIYCCSKTKKFLQDEEDEEILVLQDEQDLGLQDEEVLGLQCEESTGIAFLTDEEIS